MLKISLFQLLILEMHSVLESRNRIDDTHFWPFPRKKDPMNQNLFSFELVSGYLINLYFQNHAKI